MRLYTYQNWQIVIIPRTGGGWAFCVRNCEGEPRSDCGLYTSVEAALSHARLYVDFEIDRQFIQRRIMSNLDILLEAEGIDVALYVEMVRFLRDGLSLDRTKPG